jgi:hypothetical protein
VRSGVYGVAYRDKKVVGVFAFSCAASLYYVQGFKSLASEVLHFKNFSHDGIVGVGAITYGTAIRINNECKTSPTNFENKGVRQGIIQSDKQLNPGAKTNYFRSSGSNGCKIC